MNQDNEFSPSGIRNPGDRRAGSPVPGAGMSLSSEGLPPVLTSGTGGVDATEETKEVAAVRSSITESGPGEVFDLGATLAKKIIDNIDRRSVTPDPESSIPAMEDENTNITMDVNRPDFSSRDSENDDDQQEESNDETIEITSDMDGRNTPPITRGTKKRKAEESPSQDTPLLNTSSKEVVRFFADSKAVSKGRLRKKSTSAMDSPRGEGTRIVRMTTDALREYDTEKLSEYADECLNKMGLSIDKSKNIQGMLKNHFQGGLHNMSKVIKILVERLSDSGDISSFRVQNINLTTQIRAHRKKEETAKRELALKEKENLKLRQDMEALREEIKRRTQNTSDTKSAPRTATMTNVHQKAENFEPKSTEEYPPLPKRGKKPRITLQQRFVGSVSRVTDESGGESKSEMEYVKGNALASVSAPAPKSSRGKPSPRKGRKTDIRPRFRFADTQVEDIQGDTGPIRELSKMSEQIAQLTACHKEIRDMLACHSDEPPDRTSIRKLRKSRKESLRSETSEVSGTLDEETSILSTPAPPLEELRQGSRAPLTNRNRSDNARDGPRRIRRPPKTAAVAITSTKADVSYADILRKARENIQLESLGIENSRIRKGINGGIIIEIPSADSPAKANNLATKLKQVLGADTAHITRPTTMAGIRIWNLDDSISPVDIVSEISIVGDCDKQSIKLGTIRTMNNGMRSVWAKCPLSAAAKITNTNKIKIGWTVARVELLEAKPVQCYKCWRFGHVRNNCSFPENRTGHCFRCGAQDHRIEACKSNPHCVICAGSGKPSDHRLGSVRACFEKEPPKKNLSRNG